jgi:YD repeat-containing protein
MRTTEFVCESSDLRVLRKLYDPWAEGGAVSLRSRRQSNDGDVPRLDGGDVTATTGPAGSPRSPTGRAARVAYGYRPDGSLQQTINSNGTTATYAYDNARRLVDILHAGEGPCAQASKSIALRDAAGSFTSGLRR